MASRDAEELFESLPEQAAPERASRGRPRLRIAERRQAELRAVTLDDLVPDDHRVRLVWRFVEEFDPTALHATIKAVEGQPGHPPPDPRILVALWLFATIEGIGSAREVARLCQEHIAYQWLCGGVGMNARTLADFRIGHSAVLERLLVDSFTALIQAGVASLERVAQDGVRVRASAGAASFRRHSTLQECRDQAAETVRRLRVETKKDPAASHRRQAAARRRAAEDRERRVRDAPAVAEALQAQQQERARQEAERTATAEKTGAATKPRKEPEKEPRASTTDAEARIMKMADGGFRPAFNVQFASDTQSHAIAGASVDNVGSDIGKMTPMNEILAADYGQRPEQYLADGGCAKLDEIEALAEIGIESYVPVPKPRDANRDRYAPLPSDPPGIAAWRERMGRDAAKTIYKERAATAECANAQARNRGSKPFVVRGLEKVRAIALWYALAHNMACTWRLVWA
jgi:transposase